MKKMKIKILRKEKMTDTLCSDFCFQNNMNNARRRSDSQSEYTIKDYSRFINELNEEIKQIQSATNSSPEWSNFSPNNEQRLKKAKIARLRNEITIYKNIIANKSKVRNAE
jgi:predicted component of viral defense system (DUF524 family)